MRNLDRGLLPDLNVFLTIVRKRSMKTAAIEMGVTTSALSHRMRKLEAKLGIRLLNRTSRALDVTESGRILARDIEDSFQNIDESLDRLQKGRARPAGRLRINVLRDAARLVLGPILPAYFDSYPDMHLDIVADDRFVDIVSEGFDAGIRYGDRVSQDMIAVSLTQPLDWIVVASPDLIQKYGYPSGPKDLINMPCIQTRVGDNSHFPWELGNGTHMERVDVRGRITANETDHTVDAAIRGLGFAYVLKKRVEREISTNELQMVLGDWASEGPPLSIYYPTRRQLPPGLRSLIEMIRSHNGLAPLVYVQ